MYRASRLTRLDRSDERDTLLSTDVESRHLNIHPGCDHARQRSVLEEGGQSGTRTGSRCVAAMSGERIDGDPEGLGAPCQEIGHRVQQRWTRLLFVEVAFTADEEMTGGVVFGERIACEVEGTTFEDVAGVIDQEVIGQIGEALGLMERLV